MRSMADMVHSERMRRWVTGRACYWDKRFRDKCEQAGVKLCAWDVNVAWSAAVETAKYEADQAEAQGVIPSPLFGAGAEYRRPQ